MLPSPYLANKLVALAAYGAVNPHPEAVTDRLFAASVFLDAHDLVQTRYEMVRRVAVDGQAITGVAATFGVSRQTVYQAQAAFEARGLPGLLPRRRGPHCGHKLRPEIVAFLVQAWRTDRTITVPVLRQQVEDRFGIRVHRRSIERVLAEPVKGGAQLPT
jgi:transposase